MKIALIKPNNLTPAFVYPLGLGYMSSCLKQNNINSIIIDAAADNLSDRQIIGILKKENINTVGISCLTADYNQVARLSQALKKEGFKVIVGGIHPTFLPYETLVDTKADFVICGEGETAFTKLALNNFLNNGIKGVYSLDNLKSAQDSVEFAEIIENLDEIPFPSWEDVNFKKYDLRPFGQIHKKTPIGSIITSRGCSGNCMFCASPKFSQRRVRFRSVKNIISEIKELVNVYGVKEIKFLDDNIALNKKFILELCGALIESKLNVCWSCPNGVRADSLDEEIIAAMKRSGCYSFSVGIENASPEILKNMQKQKTIGQITKTINLAHKHKIAVNGSFIFGLPGETKETMQKTLDFALKSNLAFATFSIYQVLPGSELWDRLNWKLDKNNLDNPYSTPTYISEALTAKDLVKFHKKAYLKFYLRLKILLKLLPFIKLGTMRHFFKRSGLAS